MMRKPAALLLFIAALGTTAYAAPDPEVQKCMGQRYENHIRACLDQADRQAEAGMALNLRKAMDYGDEQHAAKLRKSQRAFLSYRDAECDAEGDTMRGGTLDSDDDAACLVEKDHARAAELFNDMMLAAH